MTQSDEELLNQARVGDKEALEILLLRHAPAVRAALAHEQPDNGETSLNDIMYVTYLEAFSHVTRFKRSASELPHWLTRIARWNLRDARAPSPTSPGEPTHDAASKNGSPPAWVTSLLRLAGHRTHDHVDHETQRNALIGELAPLPEDYTRALLHLDFDRKPIHELAHELECSHAGARLLYRRALRHLQRRFGSRLRPASA